MTKAHIRQSKEMYYNTNKHKQEPSSSWDGRPWSQQTCAKKRRRAGPRSTSVPSGIFTHPAVWPQ